MRTGNTRKRNFIGGTIPKLLSRFQNLFGETPAACDFVDLAQ